MCMVTLIVGALMVSVCICACILVVLLLYRRNKKHNPKPLNDSNDPCVDAVTSVGKGSCHL